MILVDTSVWVDHLRSDDTGLAVLLDSAGVLGHPHITGELALGSLSRREEVVGLLRRLPQAVRASDDEVLRLIESERLFGQGIGYVDAHLLAATRLTADARLWTRDRRLATVAERLGIGFGAS